MTNSSQNQIVILIFGMHRSGTSAFAGLLNQVGIPMGKNLMQAGYDNPKGFFENEKIVAFNEGILNTFGQSWDTIFQLPDDWINIDQIKSLQTQATQLIQSEFKDIPLFALKDPRFSLTLPFWKAIFNKLEIKTKQYILVRHPYEVAASLWKRNQMPKQQALALWVKYMLQGFGHSKEEDCQFIDFETLLNQPLALLNDLEKSIGVKLKNTGKIAEDFIQNELRHHHTAPSIKEPFIAEIYAALIDATKAESPKNWIKLQAFQQSPDYQEWIPKRDLWASLAIDYGKGWNEQAPQKIIIQPDTKQLTFKINKSKDSPLKFRISLANILTSIKLKDIYCGLEDGHKIEITDHIHQSLIAHQDWFVFNKEGFIEFYPLGNTQQISQINIELVYLKIGKNAQKDIPLISQKIRTDFEIPTFTIQESVKKNRKHFWLDFFKTGMKSPISFFKNINIENFKTLQKALMNEPPSVILGNLRKLLRNQNKKSNSQTTRNWQPATDNPQLATGNWQPNQHITFKIIQQQLNKSIKAELGNNKKGKILYFASHLPDFDQSSGGKRATRYLTLLAEDFEVYVYSLANQPAKYVEKLTQKDIQVLPQIDPTELQQKIPFFKAIICSTYPVFAAAENLIKQYPNATIILDTVDVHWLREERSIGLIEGLTKEKITVNKTQELAIYAKVDRIWAVTETDKAAILKELPKAKVDIISNVHDQEITEFRDNGKHSLLFLGNYLHLPNISAVKKLALDIFPTVKAAIPAAELIIAGANAPKEIEALGQLSGVNFIGFIADETLSNLYQNTFLSVSPLLAGAGIKGKICEAIAYKTPVLTNAIGNEGIDLIHEEEGLVSDISAMPEIITKALRREYDFEKMTDRAALKLAKLVGSRSVKSRLLATFFPEVSICIVTYNRLALLKKCLQSIKINTHYPNYKILVFSNACTDGTVDYLKELSNQDKRITPIFSPTNEVFVRPNNKMMRLFPMNEVVLLNNDTQVQENWLLELHRAAYASKDFGIAGAKILYPDGRLQEFGAEIYEAGNGQNIGKGDNPNQPIYQALKQVGYVSGCAMYIKRSTIQKIGVFDEQFHPCYYEDSDYCYTAAEKGLKTVVTPHSIIYHEEGATAGKNTNTGFKRFQEINKIKFIKKHYNKNNGIHWTIPNPPTRNPQLATGNSQLATGNPQPATRNPQPPTPNSLIFTHIPKCGGTSFRQFINDAALQSGLKPEEIYIPGFNGIPNAKNLEQLQPSELAQLKKQPLKILANHSKFEEHTRLGIHLDKPFYYTILREPVSRFISHYNFFYCQQGLDGCKDIPFENLPKEKQQYLKIGRAHV